MIRISLRNPAAASGIAERVSVCILIGLALISVASAVEHIRVGLHPATRQVARTNPPPPRRAFIAVAAAAVPLRPAPRPEIEPKTPEPEKIARNEARLIDMNRGEADRGVPSDAATVIARQRDLPMLRDDRAFQTWGGEFARGDARLKEMILAGALTSVQRGAKVKILETRGGLAHVEVIGEGRNGWIRSSSVGR